MSVPGSQANPPYTEAVPPAVPTVTASAVPTGQPYYGAPGADNVQSAGGGYAQSAYVAQPVQSPALGEKTQGNPVVVQHNQQPVQQPVIYATAVPVQQQPQVTHVQYQQPPPRQTVVTVERYCGPISLIFGLLLAFFIGPFALLVFACPMDERPRQVIYTR